MSVRKLCVSNIQTRKKQLKLSVECNVSHLPAGLVDDDDATGAADSGEHHVQGLCPGLLGLQPPAEAGDDSVCQHHLGTVNNLEA